ncbi:hypothetical protein [Marinicella litoralis]|uniref:Uncharacterized protein n=1 Tax=Marinicella litoralis TaxID=644220 RepID=A0A4V3DI19_9GAMM|nr:hypothetical protein [Marinicella litoralis]TDR20441.1 hypothetical protein C8D91_1413 [Marinicella litoralis]
MKKSNEFPSSSGHSDRCIHDDEPLAGVELDKIRVLADKESALDHHEIRELTKIILKIDPVKVDESLQAKFNSIMHKVRAQFAQQMI